MLSGSLLSAEQSQHSACTDLSTANRVLSEKVGHK